VAAPRGARVIALAGNPNSGKTTLFNALTGLRQKVGNYPGVTVERKVGQARLLDGSDCTIIDLPGTYSLISRSPDERVAMEVLRGLREDTPAPDAVVVVVDASNLQRNLYLVSQLIELGMPLVVALNMTDIAARRGLHVSAEDLSRELGVPVVSMVGHRRRGVDELKAAIPQARVAMMPDWPIPAEMREELLLVGGGLAILDGSEGIACESVGLKPRADLAANPDQQRLDRYQAIAERLLVGDSASDLQVLSQREPVRSLLGSAQGRMQGLGIDAMQADIEAHYRWIEGVARRCTRLVDELAAMGVDAPPADPERPVRPTMSERADAILVHKIWGLLIFALIMASLFVSIFWLAAPIQDAVEGVVGWLGAKATAPLADGPLKALLEDGIFAGVGAVVVFLPQIALLFLFLAAMEDSGYLARAAFLMDRLLARVGLHGKSFIPLLSSFACAIPGILATRTIEDRRDRLATILVAPFMSCSARLPVYTLLIGAFFAAQGPLAQAGMMLALYAFGIIAAAVVAWIFRRSFLRGPTPSFILELPTYKIPQAAQVLRQVWTNSSEFLKKAGTIIFAMSVLLWAINYYPRLPEARVGEIEASVAAAPLASDAGTEGAARSYFEPPAELAGEAFAAAAAEARESEVSRLSAAAQREYSIAGRAGKLMEPVLTPLGYDWKIGVGLIGSFAAREVFVSTMAITYAAEDPEDGGSVSLAEAMQADRRPDGTLVWTPLIAVSVLVWFVLAMQCVSTVAVVRRETQSWGWPLFQLAYMNVLAYVICLAIYQVGSRIY
jgi:ferrous iron transport protein B